MNEPWKLARDLRPGDRVALDGFSDRGRVVQAEPNRQRLFDELDRPVGFREAVMIVFEIETGRFAGQRCADFPDEDAKVRTS